MVEAIIVQAQFHYCREVSSAMQGSPDTHMKETNQSNVLLGEPSRNRRRRRGKTNFSNSKQRRQRESKKEEPIREGRKNPLDFSERDKGGLSPSWRLNCRIRPLDLA